MGGEAKMIEKLLLIYFISIYLTINITLDIHNYFINKKIDKIRNNYELLLDYDRIKD